MMEPPVKAHPGAGNLQPLRNKTDFSSNQLNQIGGVTRILLFQEIARATMMYFSFYLVQETSQVSELDFIALKMKFRLHHGRN